MRDRITSVLGSVTAADAIEDAANGPARRIVIDPIVAREETALLHSQPRDGKTWFMLAAGLAVATGEKFAGRFPTEQTNVLYASNEDSQRATAKRVHMLMNAVTMKRAPEGFRLFVGRGLWLDDPDWQQRLIDEVLAFEIGLVMYEPLRSVTACVDRGPAELQPLSRFERRLIGETGCAIWRGHHETKPLTGFADDRRPAQRSSGGGLFSISDAPISIERVDDTKSRFVPDGFKHADTPAPFIVERIAFDGVACLNVIDAPERQTGADLALVDSVRDFLRQHPESSQAEVQRTLKKQKEAIKQALETLAAAREARCLPKGKANLWSLS
jgi:AAA domain-containing protein